MSFHSTTLLAGQKGKMDPNACQTQKITALMLACKHGHDEIVKKLLDIPSLNINAQDSQRWTALMYAIGPKYVENISSRSLKKNL